MGIRTKHTDTEYEQARRAYRAASPRHVVSFEADMQEDQKRHLFALADDLRQAGNELAGLLWRRYEQMTRTKKYRGLKKAYGWHCDKIDGMDESSDGFKQLEAAKKNIAYGMAAMQKAYGVTWDDARKEMERIAAARCLPSIFALSRAEDIWVGMERILYKDGQHIHFRKRGDLPSIQAKQAERGIPIHVDKNTGELYFSVEGVGGFGLLPICGDTFLEEEYAAIVDYLRNPGQEEDAVGKFASPGILNPVFRPCYAALKCETIRGRLRVFVQITVAAYPKPKKRKDGSPRHTAGHGRVGIDLGTQSCAAVSDGHAELFNLAERNGHCTKEYGERKKFLLRAMDRSRRAMNPDRFEKDGTYKKGSRGKWINSKHYLAMREELHELERRNADSRKYAAREDANRLRGAGDVCIIEPANTKKLQKRAKPATGQAAPPSASAGTVQPTANQPKRRKRFGKSILHRCPGAFQTELKKKFGDGYHEVPQKYRASQYDHELNQYIKKKLSQRWHSLPDGKQVQRDLYSAFLLYCADNSYTEIDRPSCLAAFGRFWESHNVLVNRIAKSGRPVCNSGISVQ